jgi:hypothetical protein
MVDGVTMGYTPVVVKVKPEGTIPEPLMPVA